MPSGIAAAEDRKASRILIKSKQPGRYCFVKISLLKKTFKYFPMEGVEGQRERLLFVNGVFFFLWKTSLMGR